VARLREWLAAAPSYGKLTAADIETLSNDPPLPFFVLFEAMQQPQEGRHLGPLGSIIIAEVIFGTLASARLPYGDLPIAEQLAGLSANYYSTNVFREIPDIEDMAQLVEFTAEIADLKQAVPAFL
jgi:hypothetical protein